jgi:hypothetical protein
MRLPETCARSSASAVLNAEEEFVLHRDASPDPALGMMGREMLIEVTIPPQPRQFHNRG